MERDRVARWRAILLQLVVFACVGGALNVLYALLYVLLRAGMGAQPANAIALVLSTIVGTYVHRRFTFGVRSAEHTATHQSLGLVLLGFSLAVTAGSLWLLDATVQSPTRTQEVAVLVAANLGSGLVRFVAFRLVMYVRPRRARGGPGASAAAPPRGGTVRPRGR